MFDTETARVAYMDPKDRPCAFGIEGTHAVVLAERNPRMPMIYEPYPQLYQFARVLGKLTVGEECHGVIVLNYAKGHDSYKVVSARITNGKGDATEMDIEARDGERRITVHILGRPVDDYARLRREVEEEIAASMAQASK